MSARTSPSRAPDRFASPRELHSWSSGLLYSDVWVVGCQFTASERSATCLEHNSCASPSTNSRSAHTAWGCGTLAVAEQTLSPSSSSIRENPP